MSANTKIEWCDHTFNPWIGCTKVSAGCLNCYAEARDIRLGGGAHWGKGAPRQRTNAGNWKLPLKWNDYTFTSCPEGCGWSCQHVEIAPTSCPACDAKLRWRKPRVFCASLADWLDDEVPIEWLADLLALIHATPNLDWLLLSKRPGNWQKRTLQALTYIENAEGWSDGNARDGLNRFVYDWLSGYPPANVWIGTTVENQAMADLRIPQLLAIPAAVRFLSCEPLLGPISFRWLWVPRNWRESQGSVTEYEIFRHARIHWVIVGGESGRGARPMHPEWARSLRDECAAAGVPFLFKQWGEFMPFTIWDYYPENNPLVIVNRDGSIGSVAGDISDGSIINSCNAQDGWEPASRVGKKQAGRQLDGVEHSGFPQP